MKTHVFPGNNILAPLIPIMAIILVHSFMPSLLMSQRVYCSAPDDCV